MDTKVAGTFEGKTSEEWRAEALRSRQSSDESFDRCDTDGFLSQWASQLMASAYEIKAHLADSNGLAEFTAIFDLDGNYVPAEQVEGNWGLVWRLYDATTYRTVGWFNESNAQNPVTVLKNNAKKGYFVGSVKAHAQMSRTGRSIEPVDLDAGFEIVNNGK